MNKSINPEFANPQYRYLDKELDYRLDRFVDKVQAGLQPTFWEALQIRWLCRRLKAVQR
jgi:hypothetical protein